MTKTKSCKLYINIHYHPDSTANMVVPPPPKGDSYLKGKGCELRILDSLRVFMAEHQNFYVKVLFRVAHKEIKTMPYCVGGLVS